MNIHEYQAKELLEKFGVATPRGRVASTADEAERIARELAPAEIAVKAQVHAGGRGKGTFTNGGREIGREIGVSQHILTEEQRHQHYPT